MRDALVTLLVLSLSGSVLMGVIALLRRLIRDRLPQSTWYLLWIVVLLRLALPVASPLPLYALLPEETPLVDVVEEPGIDAPAYVVGIVEAPRPDEADPAPTQSASDAPVASSIPTPTFSLSQILFPVLSLVWLAGFFFTLLRTAIPYARFSREIRKNSIPSHAKDQEILAQLGSALPVHLLYNPHVTTPMLMGVFRPCIVTPMELPARSLVYALRHELTHLRRGDIFIKWATVLVTAVHWFNPLMIVLKKELANACELSCDEAVIRDLTEAQRLEYGETLIRLAAAPSTYLPKAVSVAFFGEKLTMRTRILSIKHYRRPGPWVVLLATMCLLLVMGCGVCLSYQQMEVQEPTPTASATVLPSLKPSPAPTQAQPTAAARPTARPTPTPIPVPLTLPALGESVVPKPLEESQFGLEPFTLPEGTQLTFPDITAWQYEAAPQTEETAFALGREAATRLWGDGWTEEKQESAHSSSRLLLTSAGEETIYGMFYESLRVEPYGMSYEAYWRNAEENIREPFYFVEPPSREIAGLVEHCRQFAIQFLGDQEFLHDPPIVDIKEGSLGGSLEWRIPVDGIPFGTDRFTVFLYGGNIEMAIYADHQAQRVTDAPAPEFFLNAEEALYCLNHTRSAVPYPSSAFTEYTTLRSVQPAWTYQFHYDENLWVPCWEFVISNEQAHDGDGVFALTGYINAFTGETLLPVQSDGLYPSPYAK